MVRNVFSLLFCLIFNEQPSRESPCRTVRVADVDHARFFLPRMHQKCVPVCVKPEAISIVRSLRALLGVDVVDTSLRCGTPCGPVQSRSSWEPWYRYISILLSTQITFLSFNGLVRAFWIFCDDVSDIKMAASASVAYL